VPSSRPASPASPNRTVQFSARSDRKLFDQFDAVGKHVGWQSLARGDADVSRGHTSFDRRKDDDAKVTLAVIGHARDPVDPVYAPHDVGDLAERDPYPATFDNSIGTFDVHVITSRVSIDQIARSIQGDTVHDIVAQDSRSEFGRRPVAIHQLNSTDI
jgi:hypothetical protein